MNDDCITYHKDLVKSIFAQKKKYHHDQSTIPIEDKIKKLVELQKIDLTIRPKKSENDRRLVWEI